MRRPTSALAKALLSTALAATTTLSADRVQAQPPPPMTGSGSDAGGGAAGSPMNPARSARHLVRNGWDYIAYQEYERALGFFREAESRKAELTEAEKVKLAQGIERAQRGLRETSIGMRTDRPYARSGRNSRPGALALANPAGTPEREPIRLAGGGDAAASNAANVNASGEGTRAATAPRMTPAPLPALPDVEPVPLPNLGGPAEPAPAPAATPSPAPAADALPDPVLPPPGAPASEPAAPDRGPHAGGRGSPAALAAGGSARRARAGRAPRTGPAPRRGRAGFAAGPDDPRRRIAAASRGDPGRRGPEAGRRAGRAPAGRPGPAPAHGPRDRAAAGGPAAAPTAARGRAGGGKPAAASRRRAPRKARGHDAGLHPGRRPRAGPGPLGRLVRPDRKGPVAVAPLARPAA
ncbi:MAG: hypothetical protein U0835_05005 [Isosphaeraceae bacterium]